MNHRYDDLPESATLEINKLSNYYKPKFESGILWNDSTIKINWPIKKPILSKKDSKGLELKKIKNLPK